MLFFKFFPVLLTLVIISTTSYADKKIVKVATLEDYKPFCMLTSGQNIIQRTIAPGNDIEFTGYCWDVLRESFHVMGYTIQLTVTPWARAMLNVKIGEADILFPTGKNSERLEIFDYSEESTNQANFIVYINKDSYIAWEGLKELKGLSIGVKRGFNYGDKWGAVTGITKYEIKTIAQGFKMLSANRLIRCK